MEVCFYNMNHIGDIYFSALFINLICKLNKNMNFLYYFFNGDIFFKTIPNIQRITPLENNYLGKLINGEPPENLINNDILQLLQNHKMETAGSKIIEFNGKHILFINTWCNSSYLKHNDYDIKSAIVSYENLIQILKSHHNLILNYEIKKPTDLIDNIILFKNNNDFHEKNTSNEELKDSIFIFNFKPRSLSFDVGHFNTFITHLSKNSKVILTCYDPMFDNNNNIKFTDKDYHIYPTPSCENLLNIWDIASQCCKIIILPTGSSWTFLHKINIIKQNQIFMFKDKKYCDLLNEQICFLFGENKNLVNMCSF